jgi:GMP synthase (glutamine-hydrolysing)
MYNAMWFTFEILSILFQIMSKKVLIIQHSTGVQPAYAATFFSEQNIPFEVLCIFDSEVQSKLPANDTDEYSAIVTLGGPQSAYEDDLYPYIKWEKAFLVAQLALHRPILGICLGAQLLADAIGGRGHPGKHGYEAGYVDYQLTPEGQQDPIMSKVFAEQANKPLLIMHHGDTFEQPPNSSILAYTSNQYIAAYRVGSALGVQFHPEASFQEFSEWVERTQRKWPGLYGNLDIDEILRQAKAFETQADRSRRLFFQTWWNSLQQSSIQSK